MASFDFAESRLVAEIYAQALEQAGVPVRRELGLGPRELVSPALRQGLVDVVPEYLGSALAALAPGRVDDDLDTAAARQRLAAALAPARVEVLQPSPAQNRNVFVVTAELAARHQLRRLSDLAPLAGGLTLAGPAECPARRHCLQGLRDLYGLDFAGFVVIDGPAQAQRALDEGVAQVVVMFSTDGQLADPALLALEDDRGLQAVENLVPVVRREALDRHGDVLVGSLDRVSTHLSEPNLRFLNWRVTVAGGDVAAEATAWLLRQGLVAR